MTNETLEYKVRDFLELLDAAVAANPDAIVWQALAEDEESEPINTFAEFVNLDIVEVSNGEDAVSTVAVIFSSSEQGDNPISAADIYDILSNVNPDLQMFTIFDDRYWMALGAQVRVLPGVFTDAETGEESETEMAMPVLAFMAI